MLVHFMDKYWKQLEIEIQNVFNTKIFDIMNKKNGNKKKIIKTTPSLELKFFSKIK